LTDLLPSLAPPAGARIAIAGGGGIVHVTSGLGSYGGTGYGPYAISKGGMNTLVRILARENAPSIRANAVAPGLVNTAFTRGGTGRSAECGASSVDLAKYLQQVPLGRAAEPDDSVGPILFLLGPASMYISGQILHVNGGGYLP
jgi:3-oxoacyl-[acyl-carrier protein] reductase